MKLYELNPHIRYARIHKSPFRTRKEESICYDARFFYFENTEGYVSINGIKYNISSKTALYIPPLQRYRFSLEDRGNTQVITIDFDLNTDFYKIKSSLGTANARNFEPGIAPHYELPEELSAPLVKNLPEISSMLIKCTKNFIVKDSFYRERSSALLKLALLDVLNHNKEYVHSELCEGVLRYVRENYSDPALTNEAIAAKFSYHSYHINRVVKRETGKPLKSYIIYYRLEMAKNELLTTRYNISEIAFRTGFASSAHFIKIFREKIGVTPGEYRASHLHSEI